MNYIKIDRDELEIRDFENREFYFHKNDPEKSRDYFNEIIIKCNRSDFLSFDIDKNTNIK